MNAIETRSLQRRFPGGQGVHELDLHVPAGRVYGFLGPNGAGKTTTIRLALGLLRPDRGEIRLHGEPLATHRRAALARVGAMVESPSLYPHLSGRENLEVSRRLLRLPAARIGEVLQRVALHEDADRRVREYSLGMRQRLGIALALLGAPRLLLLDEPTNGLDPAGIVDMRALLRRLAGEDGITVFLSSHLLGEIEQVADDVGVLVQGRLRFQGTLQALRERFPDVLEIRCGGRDAAAQRLREAGERVEPIAADRLRVDAPRLQDHAINRLLVEAGHAVHELVRGRRSLENMFFALTAQPETQS